MDLGCLGSRVAANRELFTPKTYVSRDAVFILVNVYVWKSRKDYRTGPKDQDEQQVVVTLSQFAWTQKSRVKSTGHALRIKRMQNGCFKSVWWKYLPNTNGSKAYVIYRVCAMTKQLGQLLGSGSPFANPQPHQSAKRLYRLRNLHELCHIAETQHSDRSGVANPVSGRHWKEVEKNRLDSMAKRTWMSKTCTVNRFFRGCYFSKLKKPERSYRSGLKRKALILNSLLIRLPAVIYVTRKSCRWVVEIGRARLQRILCQTMYVIESWVVLSCHNKRGVNDHSGFTFGRLLLLK